MTNLDLRPLSIGEILDRSFSLYRRYFLMFIGIAAIPQLLVLAFGLAQIFLFGSYSQTISQGRPVIFPTITASGILITLVSLVVTLFAYALAQGGTISAVTELYLGRATTIEASFQRAWREVGTLIGTGLLNGLMIGLATLALIIPGIWVACRLFVCLPVALVENRNPSDALSRTWNLTKGFAGRAFILGLIYVIVAGGLGLLAGIPLGMMVITNHEAASTPVFLAINRVLTLLISVITTPLLLIGTSIFYFDLRVRKEAFDLQLLMDPMSESTSRGDLDIQSIR